MDAENRIKMCRLIERMEEDPQFAKKLGLSVRLKKCIDMNMRKTEENSIIKENIHSTD